MVSPQKEKGHIRIATGKASNDVFSALAKASLNGQEYQVILWVIRQTWGYNKKEDWISLSQFTKELGIDRAHLCRIIKKLVDYKLLHTRKMPGKTFYRFNKTFSEWVVDSAPLVAWKLRGSSVQGNQVVACTPHTKDNITKAIIQKREKCTECNGTQQVKVGKTMIRCPLCRDL